MDRVFLDISYFILYMMLPKDIHFKIPMEMNRHIESLKTNVQNIQKITLAMKERYIIQDIRNEYIQDEYAWNDFEADCDDWYMDICHLWDEIQFHILFDDSTPPFVENILKSRQQPSMHLLL
jgi:hypothetical protein